MSILGKWFMKMSQPWYMPSKAHNIISVRKERFIVNNNLFYKVCIDVCILETYMSRKYLNAN